VPGLGVVVEEVIEVKKAFQAARNVFKNSAKTANFPHLLT
jgi:hypothetical protein